jgi:hypothetical protein
VCIYLGKCAAIRWEKREIALEVWEKGTCILEMLNKKNSKN